MILRNGHLRKEAPTPWLVRNIGKTGSKEFDLSFKMLIPLMDGIIKAFKKLNYNGHEEYQKSMKEVKKIHGKIAKIEGYDDM